MASPWEPRCRHLGSSHLPRMLLCPQAQRPSPPHPRPQTNDFRGKSQVVLRSRLKLTASDDGSAGSECLVTHPLWRLRSQSSGSASWRPLWSLSERIIRKSGLFSESLLPLPLLSYPVSLELISLPHTAHTQRKDKLRKPKIDHIQLLSGFLRNGSIHPLMDIGLFPHWGYCEFCYYMNIHIQASVWIHFFFFLSVYTDGRDFLVGSAVKNLAAMQETWVQSLVEKDHTYCRATKPVCYNYWACALEPRNGNYWNPRAPKQDKPPQ